MFGAPSDNVERDCTLGGHATNLGRLSPTEQVTTARLPTRIHSGRSQDCAESICKRFRPQRLEWGWQVMISKNCLGSGIRNRNEPFGCHMSDVNLHLGGLLG